MALTDNLVAYWELGEASGTRNDSHGTKHLTDNNTVTQAVGKVGDAAQFTAANSEYLSITDNPELSAGNFDFTLGGWFYFDSISSQVLVGKHDGVTVAGSEYFIVLNDITSRVMFYVYSDDAYGVGSALTLTTATWYFVVASHDSVADQISIQVDTETPVLVGHSVGANNTTTPFTIGATAAPNTFFNGRADQVFFYKRVIGASEITALYNGGAGLSYAALSGSSGAARPMVGASLGSPSILLGGLVR